MSENLPMVRGDFQGASEPPVKNSEISKEATSEEAVEFSLPENLSAPEELVHFSKTLPNGLRSHLVMTTTALDELGGYKNVERVFNSNVDEERLFVLYTKADLDLAISSKFMNSENGETEDQATLRYFDETYGDVLRQVFEDYDEGSEEPSTPEEEAEIVETIFDGNNRMLPWSEEHFSLVSLNIEQMLETFPDLKGSLQQKIDFVLGHELDHGDNYDEEHSGPIDLLAELASDVSAIQGVQDGHHPLAFWNKRVSREEFAENLIAQRMEHELSRIIIFNEVGFWPSADRWGHATGPFIGSIKSGEVKLPENAEEALLNFETLIEAEAKNTLVKALSENYRVPSDPQEIIFSSDLISYSFAHENFSDLLNAMDIPEERSDLYNEQRGDLDSDDISKASKLLEDLKKEYPEQFTAALNNLWYGLIYEDMYSLLEDPSLPPPLVEHLEAEIDEIDEIDDEATLLQAQSDFAKRFLENHDDVYQKYIYEDYPEVAIYSAWGGDKEAWSKTLSEIALKVYSEDRIKDHNVKEAVETYLEARGVLPLAPPVVESVPVFERPSS